MLPSIEQSLLKSPPNYTFRCLECDVMVGYQIDCPRCNASIRIESRKCEHDSKVIRVLWDFPSHFNIPKVLCIDGRLADEMDCDKGHYLLRNGELTKC